MTLYADSDGDGFGDADAVSLRCPDTSGFSSLYTDCDDGDASIHPGASERCDGGDDDCDLTIDEHLTTTYYRDADGDGYGTSTDSVEACSAPDGFASMAGDCDDGIASANPDESEHCNGRDDDCSDVIDDVGVTTCVGMGACRRCGSCIEGDPLSSGFESAPAPNGSWDLNCDGMVSREFPGDPVSTFSSLAEHCGSLTETECNETPRL